MKRGHILVSVVVALLLAGCDWRSALGLRKPPPPPLPPGAVAGPGSDPLVSLEREVGVTVERFIGPALPTGQQLVFYRYRKEKRCGHGLVAYNPNRTVQSGTQYNGTCASLALALAGTGPAGDQAVLYGFIDDPGVSRVDVLLPGKQPQRAVVTGQVFYLLQPATPGARIPISGVTVVGFDDQGKELHRRTEP